MKRIEQEDYKKSSMAEIKKKLNSADLLIGFLKFYGFRMNYVMKCIYIFDENRDQEEWVKYKGCLERYVDPNNPSLIVPLYSLRIYSQN